MLAEVRAGNYDAYTTKRANQALNAMVEACEVKP